MCLIRHGSYYNSWLTICAGTIHLRASCLGNQRNEEDAASIKTEKIRKKWKLVLWKHRWSTDYSLVPQTIGFTISFLQFFGLWVTRGLLTNYLSLVIQPPIKSLRRFPCKIASVPTIFSLHLLGLSSF